MSASSSSGPSRRGLGQDVELNIASIVDCFTVLITYLLAASSFVSLGALETKLAQSVAPAPAAGQPAPADATPVLSVSFELVPSAPAEVAANGALAPSDRAPASAAPSGRLYRVRTAGVESSVEDFPQLESAVAKLKGLKDKYPGLDSVTLLSDNEVEYRDLVKTVAVLRGVMPVYFVKETNPW